MWQTRKLLGKPLALSAVGSGDWLGGKNVISQNILALFSVRHRNVDWPFNGLLNRAPRREQTPERQQRKDDDENKFDGVKHSLAAPQRLSAMRALIGRSADLPLACGTLRELECWLRAQVASQHPHQHRNTAGDDQNN